MKTEEVLDLAEGVLELPKDVLREALEFITLKEMIIKALFKHKIDGTKLPDEVVSSLEALLEDFEKIEKETITN